MNNQPAQPAAAASSAWLARPQRRLGAAGLVLLLTVANIIVPFSLDMYTPSVPQLPAYFGTTASVVNLTIVGFFLFFTVGMLLFGPISDKLGRKPVLLGGLVLYTLGSACCALAGGIWALVAFRVVQALGAGATSAVSMALVKDCFAAQVRAKMLAVLQIAAVVGPVAAPLIGGFILTFGTWRTTFAVLAVVGAACCALAVLFDESLAPHERTQEGVLGSLAHLAVPARNKGLMMTLLVASLFSVPFMAYIACGSYVYVDFFGTTQQVYTYYFAATAALTVLGPLGYLRFSHLTTPRRLTHVLLGVSLAAGLALLALGQVGPLAFCASFAVFAVAEAMIRPYTTDIMLAQEDRDAGATSALINFAVNVFGVLGMVLIMLPWPNYVVGLGVVTVGSVVLAALVWARMLTMKTGRVREFER